MHLHVDIETKNVLIIGKPTSGKTHLSTLLSKDNPNHKIIHTDDYVKFGYKEGLYRLLLDFAGVSQPTIIEGVLGYRLLRKGVELDCYYPDLVIELEVPDALMYKTYRNERPGKDVSYLKGFNAAHLSILQHYKSMPNKKPPQWVTVKNAY